MKNISTKFVLKVAGTLTIISLVVAALLAVVNEATKTQIANYKAEKTQQALSLVIEEGSSIGQPVEIGSQEIDAAAAYGVTVEEVYTVVSNGENAGYAVEVLASGSQGSIEMIVGIDINQAVTGVSIVDNSETSGIGSKVMNNEPLSSGVGVLDQFIGLSGAGSLAVGKTITAISGATVSSKGVTAGVNGALAVAEVLG